MARNPRKPCKRCPEKQKASKAVSPSVPETITVLSISSDSEAQKLWRHVLVGTGTCIGMIEQYADLKMPHVPKDDLVRLRDRLDKLISKEDKNGTRASAK